MSDKLLTNCAGDKLLTNCAGDKLLQSCPPPAPKDICTEFGLDPDLALKFTWSGTLNRCTDCWDVDPNNHWGCTAAPTSLPDVVTKKCPVNWWETISLPGSIELHVYLDYCFGYDTGTASDSEAYCFWDCVDGLFRLAVLSRYNFFPLFFYAGYNVKVGDVLGNQLTCLSWPTLPCGATSSFPAFVTGGSYKVEIAP